MAALTKNAISVTGRDRAKRTKIWDSNLKHMGFVLLSFLLPSFFIAKFFIAEVFIVKFFIVELCISEFCLRIQS